MISGSVGIMGVADTILVITKESRHAERATLHITGRDVEQSRLSIKFNSDSYNWELVGDENLIYAQKEKHDYDNNLIVKTIKALLDEAPEKQWTGTATMLLEAGKRIFDTFIATTAQKIGYELIKLNDNLYKYDKIIYEPKSNGNAGQKHSFRYAEEEITKNDDTDYLGEDFSDVEF